MPPPNNTGWNPAKLNKGDRQVWLTWVLERISDQKINRLDELMP